MSLNNNNAITMSFVQVAEKTQESNNLSGIQIYGTFPAQYECCTIDMVSCGLRGGICKV